MKRIFVMIAVVLAMVFTCAAVNASDMKETVVKGLLPDTDLKAVIFEVTDAVTAKVQAALNNKMPVRKQYELYVSKTGVVIIEEQQGKWGPIKMAISIDPETRKIKDIGFISMSEKRGSGIKQPNFIKQFAGKAEADGIEISKDIRAITGATISSRAVAIAAKRALVIYGAFTEKK